MWPRFSFWSYCQPGFMFTRNDPSRRRRCPECLEWTTLVTGEVELITAFPKDPHPYPHIPPLIVGHAWPMRIKKYRVQLKLRKTVDQRSGYEWGKVIIGDGRKSRESFNTGGSLWASIYRWIEFEMREKRKWKSGEKISFRAWWRKIDIPNDE